MDQRGLKHQRLKSQPMDEQWVSSSEAIHILGVKRETLYAYASRGLVASRPGERGRPRRYWRGDLERLKARRDARAGHGAVAAGALRWGEPVLDSAITHVSEAGPVYRGHAAVDLAAVGLDFESVAELLWTGALPSVPPRWSGPKPGFDARLASRLLADGPSPLDAMSLVVALLRGSSSVRAPLADEDELAEARRLVPLLAASAALVDGPDRMEHALAFERVAAITAVALGIEPRREAVAAIDKALVLIADHELNVSTFTARIAASAATDLLGCISAALSVLSGPRHGGMSNRLEELLDSIDGPRDVPRLLASRLPLGEAIPGFGHPLYPKGDPRALPLLDAARKSRAPDELEPRRRTLLSLVDELERRRHAAPTIDVGLVSTRLRLGLPKGSAAHLFAVGRSAGWIAHILEQRRQGGLLRPRARYVADEMSGASPASAQPVP
jgi:citrate synthase